jgi:asparagine synthase (glutamine-hydrolysing)
MFAISLYDRRSGELVLVRDRLGKKPIYYTWDGRDSTLQFASEFNCIGLQARTDHLNLDSLVWYFSQKTVPGDASIDARVRKVPAGHYLRCRADGEPQLVRYWQIAPARPSTPHDDRRSVEDVEDLLTDSVRLRMRADVEVGAFLSGGIDSSLIVALASKLTDRPLKTFCLVYDQEINHKSADRRWAHEIAARYGTRHEEVLLTPSLLAEALPSIVRQYGQPNSAVLSNWFISQAMGRQLKVALSGDGADELFGSYFLHRVGAALSDSNREGPESVLSRLPDAEARFVRENLHKPFVQLVDRFAVFPEEEQQRLFGPRLRAATRISQLLAAREAELRSTDPLDRALEFDCRNLLCEQILNYSDLLGMAHSLEIRTPFLDHRLVEYMFRVPSHLKIRNGETKWLLKQVARKYLPEGLVTRPKEGFVEPAVYWLRSELKDLCTATLESPSFNRLGLLDRDYVRALVETFYRDGDFTLGKRVWSVLMFAIWEGIYANT